MMGESEDVKRAVRTASRSIPAVLSEPPTEESHRQMAAAICQLTFAVEKIVGELEKLKATVGLQ